MVATNQTKTPLHRDQGLSDNINHPLISTYSKVTLVASLALRSFYRDKRKVKIVSGLVTQNEKERENPDPNGKNGLSTPDQGLSDAINRYTV
jgi:hypothetical protein